VYLFLFVKYNVCKFLLDNFRVLNDITPLVRRQLIFGESLEQRHVPQVNHCLVDILPLMRLVVENLEKRVVKLLVPVAVLIGDSHARYKLIDKVLNLFAIDLHRKHYIGKDKLRDVKTLSSLEYLLQLLVLFLRLFAVARLF